MSGFRVELDLGRIADNASVLVELAAGRGVDITGVTKAVLGHPGVARAMVRAGVSAIGDSRIDNIERMRAAGIDAELRLIRTPMPSQADRVVRSADTSCNTEPAVLRALSRASASAGVDHGVILMVELGDLREGIRADDLQQVVESTLGLPHLHIVGIGTNLACRSGIAPDDRNMSELSSLADSIEQTFGLRLDVVSGGNSASLEWLSATTDVGRVNDLRLGESILLGREPLHRTPIPGLRTDAISVWAEVIESKRKPTMPWGTAAQAAFGEPSTPLDRGDIWQTIVAIGLQDTDPAGLIPPPGVTIIGASSDHLVLETATQAAPGDPIRFLPGYGALLRSMTSPFAAVETTEAQIGTGLRSAHGVLG